jgi:hypothetical protein
MQRSFRAAKTGPEAHLGSFTMGTRVFGDANLSKRSVDQPPIAIAGLRMGCSCTSALFLFMHKNVDTIRYFFTATGFAPGDTGPYTVRKSKYSSIRKEKQYKSQNRKQNT